jgi:hypothetical protein
MAGAKWKEQKDRETQENTGILSKLRQDLLSAGVKESTLPTRADLKKKGEQMGLLLASSPWPELKDQAKVSTPSVKLAEEFLSLFPQPSDGLTTDLVKEVLVNREKRIDDLRKVAQTRREEKGERVPRGLSEAAAQAELDKARKDLARTEPEEGDGDDDGEGESEVVTEAEARRKLGTKPISQLREDAGITDPSENHTKKALIEMLIADGIRAGVIATGAEPAKKARRPATPKQEAVSQDLREALRGSRPAPTSAPTVSSPSPRGQRLAGYEDKRASTRRSDVKPSERVLAEAKSDVLLFTLNDGSTQVWAKGALTETFVSSRQGASWQIATRYVKNWITLKPKSRLNCRILFTAEDEPDLLEVILESAAARRTATGAAKKVPREQVLAALREEALRKNPRNPRFYPNPRSSRNRAIASEIRAEFRRNGGLGIGTLALAGVAGFVGGTYAEASFGLSKYFTQGGKATAQVVRSGKLPPMPKFSTAAPKSAAFEPSARLAKMLRDFYAFEEKKKRVPFAQAAKREAMEDRLDAMWSEIESLEAQERRKS